MTKSAATILIRFCTLWFGVLVGLVALLSYRRLISGDLNLPTAADSADDPPVA